MYNTAVFVFGAKPVGHGKHVTGSSAEIEPVADYNVATNPALVPDCSCNYFYAGEYNIQHYYRRADGAYFIWWSPSRNCYCLTATLGDESGVGWFNDVDVIGDYYQGGGTEGTAHVSAGPH